VFVDGTSTFSGFGVRLKWIEVKRSRDAFFLA
jgi:hypothetical protein